MAVIAILYSASQRATTDARTALPQFCVGGVGVVLAFLYVVGSGARNNAPPRAATMSILGRDGVRISTPDSNVCRHDAVLLTNCVYNALLQCVIGLRGRLGHRCLRDC